MDHVVNGVGDAVESSGRGDDEMMRTTNAPGGRVRAILGADVLVHGARRQGTRESVDGVHLGFLLALVLMFVASRNGDISHRRGRRVLHRLVFLVFACIYGTMIAHEMAHIEVCRRFGGRVDEDKGIILWPSCVGVVHLDGLTLSQELAVTLAGPVSHAPMALFWFLLRMLKLPSGISETPTILFEVLFQVNKLMLIWHFLPCYPMDGSRVLACLVLLTRRVRVETAAWIVCIVSYVCTVLYIIFSFATGLSSPHVRIRRWIQSSARFVCSPPPTSSTSYETVACATTQPLVGTRSRTTPTTPSTTCPPRRCSCRPPPPSVAINLPFQ